MLNFKIVVDKSGQKTLETPINGKALLTIPQLNKGTAFSLRERHEFSLMGKLPSPVETLQEQVARVYRQVCKYDELINRNTYLTHILNHNQVLFYKLVKEHIEELLPVIYTPIVGEAVENYSAIFTQPRGLYISYEDMPFLDEILNNRSNPEVDIIVVSDGEGVLGIGDQGVGAMAIPVAKLAVYTLFGGIDPNRTLPILLDVGTNNERLLKDPVYLGWRHPRISGREYDEFVDAFVAAIQRNFPNVFLHWEDFGRKNAYRNLNQYRDKLCTFNDDIQGTGVVALAALIAAVKKKKERLQDQRIVVFGAGSAGMGITYSIFRALQHEGLSPEQAAACFYLVDKSGLLQQKSKTYSEAQKVFLRHSNELQTWDVKDPQRITLAETIKNAKPTVLIGTSAQHQAFTEELIKLMAEQVAEPIIFPLSNPNTKCEADPNDLLAWTDGKALIATGSPFKDIQLHGKPITISQCNNYVAFPGIGLGVTAVCAKQISNTMLYAASLALSRYSKSHHELLPSIREAIDASNDIAIAVAKAAVEENHHQIKLEKPVEDLIKEIRWEPSYVPYRLISED